MTREKEIKEASSEYIKNYGYFNVDLNDVESGFIDGAKWADGRPKSPWHSVADGDLPQVNKRCLFSYEGNIYIGYRCITKDVFLEDVPSLSLTVTDFDYWMEIPKLPTE
jgi:hypothetical protein|nr:MAG TPA: hypothetical protein [Caudoviricetes sp.]